MGGGGRGCPGASVQLESAQERPEISCFNIQINNSSRILYIEKVGAIYVMSHSRMTEFHSLSAQGS